MYVLLHPLPGGEQQIDCLCGTGEKREGVALPLGDSELEIQVANQPRPSIVGEDDINMLEVR